jgi:hypothetical protein
MSDFQSFLAAVVDPNAAPNLSLYALVDHAGAVGLLKRLRERPGTPWINLLSGAQDEYAIEAAPLLLALTETNQQAWLYWLYNACRESTSLTLLHSKMDLQPLAQGLKSRLDVMLPDGMPVLLRYFDTRILESLLRVLDSHQQTGFFGLASCWLWLDRAGEIQRHVAESLDGDTWPASFHFSEQQQNAMIDAAEADVLVQQMQLHGMDLCSGYSRAALHALAREAGAKADGFGIDGMRSRTVFALDFMGIPEWATVLARVTCKEINFEEAVRLHFG